MHRFTSIEQAIQQALAHARVHDHDQTLLCLAYALAQTSRARQRGTDGTFPLERPDHAFSNNHTDL